MECFKKALKITDAGFSSKPDGKNFHLYVAILNKFLYYFGLPNFGGVKTSVFI